VAGTGREEQSKVVGEEWEGRTEGEGGKIYSNTSLPETSISVYIVPKIFFGRLSPDPLGSLSAAPDSITAVPWVPWKGTLSSVIRRPLCCSEEEGLEISGRGGDE